VWGDEAEKRERENDKRCTHNVYFFSEAYIHTFSDSYRQIMLDAVAGMSGVYR
jgi:hypothetical protein